MSSADPTPSSAGAEVFDLGYAGYDGPRTSRWTIRRAIVRNGVRSTLGLGRGIGAKIAPWTLLGLAILPAFGLVVISAFAGSLGADADDLDLPTFVDYYGVALIPLTLLAAIVAPVLVCPDRRERVLTLYGVRPITAIDYAGSRLAAFFAVAVAALWVPQVLLFGWNVLQADDTGDWLRENWAVAPRFLAAGMLLAGLLTALSLFAASLTTRRAFAAVAVLAAMFVGAVVGGVAEESLDGIAADALSLVGVPRTIEVGVHWIFGETLSEPHPHTGGLDVAWLAALTVGLAAAFVWRVHRALHR
jgi:ABC-2 type transport system permease protein